MKQFVISFLIIISFSNYIFSANMILDPSYKRTKIFYTDEDKQGWNAYLVGKVLSLGQRNVSREELNQTAQEKSKVTVRLYQKEGLRQGQTLFIINERNLIVSRITVQKIYKSYSFGYLLIGYGNFRRVQKDFKVALKVEESTSNYTYVYKSRGDYFLKTGDKAKAIQMYEKAIKEDMNNGSAHMKLANIYFDKKIFSFAKKEYDLAYKYIWNVYDNQDKFEICSGMAKTRYILAYESNLPAGNKLRNKYVSEGLLYSQKALELYPQSPEMNYYYGYFLYNNPDPDDTKAKNQMLKVVELDKRNINAYIILSRLYYKHRNQAKAILYAEAALRIDPSNLWAKDTYRKVQISY